ncbi:MAG TPA: M56 family metallopeptidase [Planctomycetaceae bacterium]|nr:M56 family metallopeptidase [Planctomycetaceae bacterium]
MSDWLALLPPDGFARFACDAAWQGTAVGLTAWAASRLVARRSALRAWLAALGLWAILVLPLVALFVRTAGYGMLEPAASQNAEHRTAPDELGAGFAGDGRGRLAMVPPNERGPDAAEPAGLDPPWLAADTHDVGAAAATGGEPVAGGAGDAAIGAVRRAWPVSIWTALGVVWAGMSLYLAQRLGRSAVGLAVLLREARDCRDRSIRAACRRAERQLGLSRPVRISVSASLGCPAVIGWRTPRLLIPESASRRRGDWFGICCHELAHVVRGDGWTRLLVELASVAVPWHPFVWLLRREFHRAAEEACDDWAVFAGADAVEYASTLTEWIPQQPRVLAMEIIAGRALTRRRVERLLSVADSANPKLGSFWSLTGLVGSAVLVVAVSLLQAGAPRTGLASAPVGTVPDPGREAPSGSRMPADSEPQAAASEQTGVDGLRVDPIVVLGDGRFSHWHSAEVIGFDAAGTTLISGSRDGTINFWEVPSGRLRRSVDCVHRQHRGAVLSPDRQTLYAACSGRTSLIRVYSVPAGDLLAEWSVPDVSRSLAISGDGRRLAVNDSMYGATVLDAATGGPIQVIRGQRLNALGRRANWRCVALNHDGTVLAAADGNGSSRVALFDVDSGSEMGFIDNAPPRGSIGQLCFSPDDRTLVIAAQEVRLWDVATRRQEREFQNRTGGVRAIAFGPDMRWLASAGPRDVALWSADSEVPVWTTDREFMLKHPMMNSLAVSPDGTLLAVAAEHRVILLSTSDGREVTPDWTAADELMSTSVGADGRQLATRSQDGTLAIWELPSGARRQSWPGPLPDAHYPIAYSPDGRTLACGTPRRTIVLYDALTGAARHEIAARPDRLAASAFTADSTTLATYGGEGSIQLWNVFAGNERTSLPWSDRQPGSSLAFGAPGRLFAAGGPHLVSVWDYERATPLPGFGESTVAIPPPLAVSADGGLVAAGLGQDGFEVWDVVAERRTMSRPRDRMSRVGLTALAFDSAGRTLATTGNDGQVRLWDPRTGRLLQTLKLGPSGGLIRQVAFAGDGRHLVTANGNGTVWVLPLDG